MLVKLHVKSKTWKPVQKKPYNPVLSVDNISAEFFWVEIGRYQLKQ